MLHPATQMLARVGKVRCAGDGSSRDFSKVGRGGGYFASCGLILASRMTLAHFSISS